MRSYSRSTESGQVLVIVAAGLIALIAMVGLVVDGGYAWGRQRITQNGADSIAKAGATVILQWLDGEPMTAGDVGCAVEEAAEAHAVDPENVQFTDHEGGLLGIPVPGCTPPGGGGAMPEDAQGVKATTSQDFDTFLVSVVGIDQLTARADATAVVGPLLGTGVALPITFPQTLTVCDDDEVTYSIVDWGEAGGATTWEPYEILPDPDANPDVVLDDTNLATLPMCTTGPGSVGWLEFNCGTLQEIIVSPCDTYFPIPTWIQTQTGTVNALEDELELYHGDEPGVYEPEGTGEPNPDHRVQIPIHTNTCEDDAGVSDSNGDGVMELNPCPEGVWTAGEGNNLWYGVPFWVGFILDEAHVQGGDVECEDPPGTPELENPGGDVGCIKGWFVQRLTPPTDVGIGDINPGDDIDIAVVLIN